MTRLFTGDHSTGDFSQWNSMFTRFRAQDKLTNVPVEGEYSTQVLSAGDGGYVARIEVRPGDSAVGYPDTERAMLMMGDGPQLSPVGSVRWYRFSIKFDESFPEDQHTRGWCYPVSFGHVAADGTRPETMQASSMTRMGWTFPNNAGFSAGNWYLMRWMYQNAPSPDPDWQTRTVPILEMPLDRGKWQDIKMEVKWSKGTDGYMRLWRNGQRMLFVDGSDTYPGQNVYDEPEIAAVRPAQGIYRSPDPATVHVVWFSNFRMADTEDSL